MSEGVPRILGGRYEVGELIGRGGMAEVHLGHDTRLGRQVAIKILRADLARDSTFLTRFRREAHSAAGLSHHAIVAVYDSGEDSFTETGGATVDIPYIVMEYVDGQTLREILDDEGRLSADEAARVTMGILAALEYSHQKGIVHRDIKPANVMLTKGGSVKVMDFGIARALADTGATMTSAQAVVGTARYLSPEQAQGETVDARSDLYSAGCVLFELLTGRTPFVGEPVSLVYQHITDQPKPPSVYEPSVPAAMDAVTLHSLAKGRGARYQTAGDFRADIQAARTGAPLSAGATSTMGAAQAAGTAVMDREPQAPVPPPARRDNTREIHERQPQRKLTGLWVAAGVVALLAILGIGYLVMNGQNKGTPTEVIPNVAQQTEADAKRILIQHGFDHFSVHPVTSNDVAKGRVVSTDPTNGTSVNPSTTILINVSTGPGLANVPDVTGKTVAEAKQVLNVAGFTHVTVATTEVADTEYDKGKVASTLPAAGSSADPSQPVTLTVSNGKVHVPDGLVGQDAGSAEFTLKQAHLTWKVVQVPVTDQSQQGKVQKVSPDGGKEVDKGSVVTLSVGSYSATSTSIVTVTAPPPSTPSSEPTSPSPSPSPTSTGSNTGGH